ncbi:MAG: glycosyltransferase [Chloroflexota bacterium]|nr:glycosyltransferase [Chloroflexota bacterium]
MTQTPRISVVIPVWNDREWLGGAIESVLAQGFADWELVIGDNASEDDLASIVGRYDDRRIRYRRWPTHVGASENHNRGMVLAQYEWVQVLCADDRLRTECLERIAGTISRATQMGIDLAMVVTACRRVDGRGQPADIMRLDQVSYRRVPHQRISAGVYDAARWLSVNAAPGLRPWMIGSVAIRRDLLWQIGGFRPEMGLCHDLELTMRTAAYGNVAYIDEPLLNYTVRADSITALLEDRHVQRGGPMVEEGFAWLSVLQTHGIRRTVSDHERAVVSAAIGRAFLRRALLQRGRRGRRVRWAAMLDVLRAIRHSPHAVLGSWRIAAAVAAIFAPRWLLRRAAVLGHRFGLVIV